MKISVTPVDNHRDIPTASDRSYNSHGEPITGKRAILVTADGVWVDGKPAILRDRRAKRMRSPGHDWYTLNSQGDPRNRRIGWTGFTVEVEP